MKWPCLGAKRFVFELNRSEVSLQRGGRAGFSPVLCSIVLYHINDFSRGCW